MWALSKGGWHPPKSLNPDQLTEDQFGQQSDVYNTQVTQDKAIDDDADEDEDQNEDEFAQMLASLNPKEQF